MRNKLLLSLVTSAETYLSASLHNQMNLLERGLQKLMCVEFLLLVTFSILRVVVILQFACKQFTQSSEGPLLFYNSRVLLFV